MKVDYRTKADAYNALFRPASIAIVGGSESLAKPGGKVLKNIVDRRYEGALWVVNPGAGLVAGLPTFASIADLPGAPELAIIAVPAPLVAGALEDLARKGCRAAVILSAGFGEKDEKGKDEERRLLDIATREGMTIVGPNCSGFMTPCYTGKFAGIMPELKPRSVDLISGSGALVDLVMEQAVPRGLSFCNVVNVGNSVQTGVEDLLALYDGHYDSHGSPILMMYIESLKKPDLLLTHARSLSRKGCAIVAVKSGVSGAGARAAASHTGAMATNDTAVDALFRKAGIIRVRSRMEMIDVACVLSATGGRLKGNRACVITDAGGPGVMMTDELERQGFVLPVLGEKTQQRLREVLPRECPVANPIDCFPTRTASQFARIIRILQEEEMGNLDVITPQVANPGLSHNRAIYEEVARAVKECPIPVIPTLTSVTTCRDLIEEFTGRGAFCFNDEVNLGTALGKVLRRPFIHEPAEALVRFDTSSLDRLLAGRTGIAEQDVVARVLRAAGFRLPEQVEVQDPDDLPHACASVGYPLVMKVLGPLHKSDLGGVATGVESLPAARSAWERLMAIKGARGVLIQQMIEGTEVILGCAREEKIGHLVMFGLGGIYTEVMKDVTFALAPLSKEECREMVTCIRAFPIIEGARGRAGMSVDLLADYLERLGALVARFPAIREVDLNPVKGSGADLYVVDGRIIMDAPD